MLLMKPSLNRCKLITNKTENECAPDSTNLTDVKLIIYFGLYKKPVISLNLEKAWTAIRQMALNKQT